MAAAGRRRAVDATQRRPADLGPPPRGTPPAIPRMGSGSAPATPASAGRAHASTTVGSVHGSASSRLSPWSVVRAQDWTCGSPGSSPGEAVRLAFMGSFLLVRRAPSESGRCVDAQVGHSVPRPPFRCGSDRPAGRSGQQRVPVHRRGLPNRFGACTSLGLARSGTKAARGTRRVDASLGSTDQTSGVLPSNPPPTGRRHPLGRGRPTCPSHAG